MLLQKLLIFIALDLHVKITNLANPTDDGDAVNKNVMDREIWKKTLNMGLNDSAKHLNMTFHKITNINNPRIVGML